MYTMLKGNERRVVIIKGDKDTIYDMACIFIKSEHPDASYAEDDIVKEAERIISGASFSSEREKEKKEGFFGKKLFAFLGGVISGCAVSFITYFFICALFIS